MKLYINSIILGIGHMRNSELTLTSVSDTTRSQCVADKYLKFYYKILLGN